VIRLADIYYQYPGSENGWLLKDINLSITRGEYVLVYGASGSGKSTLGYLFNGLIPHFFGGSLQGTAWVDGADTRQVPVADFLTKVGLVLQNADAQLFNSTVENEIAFGLESLGLSAGRIERQIERIAHALRLEDLLPRSPATLSGGEKCLVAIASVLCLDPPLLLLDEPFAHLDWEGARRVRQVLREIHRAGKTVVVIEQRIGEFFRDATFCLLMEGGKIKFYGKPADAYPALVEEHVVPHYPSPPPPDDARGPAILTAANLGYRIADRRILKDIAIELRPGEITAIVGRNGAGKTTLIKHFSGLLRPSEGHLAVLGQGIKAQTPRRMAAQVGIAFQNPNDQFFKNRVADELQVALKALGRKPGIWLEEISRLLAIRELMNRSPYRLSEGQKKRVAVASVLALRPRVLVLDEPTAGQDGRFLELLAGILLKLRKEGFSLVIVTHDLEFARAVAQRWIVLHQGRVVADDSPFNIASRRDLIDLGALQAPRPEEPGGGEAK
jgi:energy-coupling factor transport system ATP-binding protein